MRGPRAPRGGATPDARRHVSQLAANTLPPRAPVLVLGNKIDLPAAAREEELYYSLGLDELTRQDPTGAARPLRLFMCSVFAGTGFMEGASSPALRPATRPDAVTPCRAHLVVRPRLIRHALSHRGDERRLAAERIRRRGPRRRRRRHDARDRMTNRRSPSRAVRLRPFARTILLPSCSAVSNSCIVDIT